MEQDNITRDEFLKLEERVRTLEISSKVTNYQYEDIKKTLQTIQTDIESIKSIPNKRQEEVISKIITTIVGALIGGIIALIIK